ncbi:AbrB/MazE/SpoVT family DNA-binding domain-containing protein [Candidatus Woesearchaeota archaeon]|nr:AbrB/MazE/SpoVT family DNA-binding domain-containing protein [Candidatus Woesearchaeota archaeon]
MHRRKIQLIAGTTYSISLPKDWIRENGIKPKQEVLLYENNDRTLILSPKLVKQKRSDEITIDIDDDPEGVDQTLFSLYYIGFENINLISKKGFTKDARAKIRKTLTHMSGTEISHEDNNRIHIHVLLNVSKVTLQQVLYRIRLIIDSSISNMLEGLSISEIRMNENEIDRLYHLCSKLLSLSLIDSNVLHSSKLKNISLLPAHFLIAKKMENLADNVKHLAEYLYKNKLAVDSSDILIFVRSELARSMDHLMAHQSSRFDKMSAEDVRRMDALLSGISDKTVENYLATMLRHLSDIQQETVYIALYSKMIDDGVI